MRKLVSAIALASAALLCSADLCADDGLRLSLSLSAAPVASALAPGSPTGELARRLPARASVNDYRIGSDDLLDVQVFGVDQLSRTVRVNARGQVSLPLIGVMDVAGLTAQEAEGSITRRLAESYLQNPQVSLFIKEYTTQRVTVEGAVQRPGVYPLRGPTTLLTTLALAGGQAAMSDMSEVKLFRGDNAGKRISVSYDVEKIRRGEAEDPMVVNDDLIVVNRSAARTALRDSLFRDVIDTVNPFRWGSPVP